MFDAKSVSRALLLTTVVAVAAPAAAVARPADNGPVATHHATVVYGDATYDQQNRQDLNGGAAVTPSSVPPRVDGVGRPPAEHGTPVATPVVQAPSNGGFDWTLAAVVATALLSFALLGVAAWRTRSRRVAA
jgi:hypothetical protein